MDRRTFLKATGMALAVTKADELVSAAGSGEEEARRRPNVVFVFGDQWRAQATGYAGDPNAITPNLDKLVGASVHMTTTVSCCPVCTPYRASLLTGQYPLTTGLFLNDLHLEDKAVSLAEALATAGYDTAYIGKWHLDGRGRSAFIPRQSRQGFDYWKVLECTHRYNQSTYFADADERLEWEGYDAIAQTRDAQQYIAAHARDDKPFLLMLSWGPPHNPYPTAPEKYRKMFPDAEKIKLRPNVPEKSAARAREDLQGYYAHCAALDDCVGELLATLDECGIADDTIFVFTSDHGDMLGSQGQQRKQRPWDESILVPFLLRYPAGCGRQGRQIDMPFNAPDIMPTLLGLAGVEIPDTVEGRDYSAVLAGRSPAPAETDAALICCVSPFGEYTRARGGREYRGIRTRRHTYVRTLEGPWLLYDNEADPHQQKNLAGKPEAAEVQKALDQRLTEMLAERKDEFRDGWHYIKKHGYQTHKNGTVPVRP